MARKDRIKLLCKDCGTEIFVDDNMVMLKDDLWKSICDEHKDAICDKCMEKRMGRSITAQDFKISVVDGGMIPCNLIWLFNKFENIFMEIMDYQQYYDGRKGYDYEKSFKILIRDTWDYFYENGQEFYPDIEEWLRGFYKNNKKETHQIWLK